MFAEVGALRGLAMLDLALNLRLRDACPGDVTGTGSIESGTFPPPPLPRPARAPR